MVRNICENCFSKNNKSQFDDCSICSIGKVNHFEANDNVDDKVVNEDDFQERIQELQTILMNEENNLYEMHKFVKDDKSYRKDTMHLVAKSMREALRQLGFLDTDDGM